MLRRHRFAERRMLRLTRMRQRQREEEDWRTSLSPTERARRWIQGIKRKVERLGQDMYLGQQRGDQVLNPMAVREMSRQLAHPDETIEYLQFGHLSNDHVELLAPGFQANQSLQKLDLRFGCTFDGVTGVPILARAFSAHASLRELNFIGCDNFGDAGATALNEILFQHNHHHKISKLSLRYCDISSRGAEQLAAILERRHTSSLQELDMTGARCNKIGNDGAAALCAAIINNPHSTLALLKLEWSDIGDSAAQAFRQLLKHNNKVFKHLDLSHNQNIKEQGLKYLLEGLACNTTLTKLVLEDIGIQVSPETRHSIDCKLEANRVLGHHRPSHDSLQAIPWIFERVSLHPTAMYELLQVTNMNDLLYHALLATEPPKKKQKGRTKRDKQQETHVE